MKLKVYEQFEKGKDVNEISTMFTLTAYEVKQHIEEFTKRLKSLWAEFV